jgi:transmembrane sensor
LILICALCGVLISSQQIPVPTVAPTYSTALGEHKSIQLADSSELQLNTTAVASVKITPRSRAMTLQRGEALLSIAADPRPFAINVASFNFETKQAVRALVRLDADGGARLDILKGEGWIRPAGSTFRPLRVSAGSSFSVHYDVRIVQQFDANEMTRRLAWTKGQVVLAGEPLRDAVAEFNRYNRKQLLIGDESIAKLPTGGTFYATELDTFTRSLNQLFGIRAVRMRPDVVMLVGENYSGL